MKTKLLLTTLLSLSFYLLSSQVPQGFNYQAVARDGSDHPLPGPFTVKIAILKQVTPSEVVVYEESHNPVTPDSHGLFSIIVGQGAPIDGTFGSVDWSLPNLYIRTKIDDIPLGTPSKLYTVPYSMVTKDVQVPLTISGKSTNFADPIFEVKNSDNQPVFSVYGDGIRMHVGELGKSSKGGFSVGGFEVKADPVPYLTVTRDYTEVNANRTPGKGAKGGFSVGGFDGGKENPPSFYLNMTPKNYLIGEGSGSDINFTGLYNSVIGYQAGKSLTSGGYNTMLGYLAGTKATSGSSNILIGNSAGNNLTEGIHNTLIGNGAGYSHTDQSYNVMIGTSAGYHISDLGWNGSYNTFMGINSGFQIQKSKENVFLGTNSALWLDNGWGNTIIGIDAGRSRDDPPDPNIPWDYRSDVTADYNTILGDKAGYYLTNGDFNVAIGYLAGHDNADGSGNVFIGSEAGYYETTSNKLYIANSESNPLIYGDFSSHKLGINTTTLDETLNVGGNASITGTLTAAGINAPVTGNVTGNVNGAINGKFYFSSTDGIVASVNSGKYDIYWNNTAKTLTLRNSAGTWCHFNYQKMVLGTESYTYESSASNTATKLLITFANNSDACIISFGDENDTGYCTIWLQYSNSKLFGHYIKY